MDNKFVTVLRIKNDSELLFETIHIDDVDVSDMVKISDDDGKFNFYITNEVFNYYQVK